MPPGRLGGEAGIMTPPDGGALIAAGLAVPARLGRVSARPPDFMALLFEQVVAREAHPSRAR